MYVYVYMEVMTCSHCQRRKGNKHYMFSVCVCGLRYPACSANGLNYIFCDLQGCTILFRSVS